MIAAAYSTGLATATQGDIVATIRVTKKNGHPSSMVLAVRAPLSSDAVGSGGNEDGLPDGWRLCFTWRQAVLLRVPPGARRSGGYVELAPQPALLPGQRRAIRFGLGTSAMRQACDIPQGLHVVFHQNETETGLASEVIRSVRLMPLSKKHVCRDFGSDRARVSSLPPLVPKPLILNEIPSRHVADSNRSAIGQRLGFVLGGSSEAGPVVVVSGSASAERAASLLRAWVADWPPEQPLADGTASAKASMEPRAVGNRAVLETNPRQRTIVLLESSESHYRGFFLGAEGYVVRVQAREVVIVANAADGFLRGAATLQQSFGLAHSDGMDEVAPFEVADRPQLRYRGLMLDVARHFFPISFIKRLLDLMYLLKLNVFHWHLTDDEGWRIEIKAFPNLTARGAWRGRGEAVEPQYGGGHERYGGFYSHQDAQDIVRYARDRGIAIVPELDVPGHCYAAIQALPELLGAAVRRPSNHPRSRQSVQGFRGNVLDPAAKETYIFLEAVLTEIVELFPGPLGIHVGTDEVPAGSWSDDPAEEKTLLSRFVRWMQQFLIAKGRALFGWEEAFSDGFLDASKVPRATAVAWTGKPSIAAKAANDGFDVVLSPANVLYFDIVQDVEFEQRGLYWSSQSVTFEDVYLYKPFETLRRNGLRHDATKHVIGLQAALWTETVATPERAEESLFPRLFAMAEIAWTLANRNLGDFTWRMKQQAKWLESEKSVHIGGLVSGFDVHGGFHPLRLSPPEGSGDPMGITVLGIPRRQHT
eukprot:TRINITY_DN2724_c1_g3_i1.p1 TRINITY_DN2724_c1_g3~~TRINITY_DN2724_c1_g3_i1.p1  ORF type:complete len:826 (-),score=102.71 TRINITY_DN2724_c1_g3_i1:92-2371(-)